MALKNNEFKIIKDIPDEITRIDENEISIIAEQVSPIVAKAQELSITHGGDLETAGELLSQLNGFNDRVVEDRERITKPINAALKEIRAKYKPTEKQLEEAISIVRDKISIYQTKVTQAQQKSETDAANKIATGGSITDALEEMQDASELTVSKVKTDSGSITFTAKKTLKIIASAQVPAEYWIIDEAKLLNDLKEGKIIPGAEIEIIQVPINRR